MSGQGGSPQLLQVRGGPPEIQYLRGNYFVAHINLYHVFRNGDEMIISGVALVAFVILTLVTGLSLDGRRYGIAAAAALCAILFAFVAALEFAK